ncbi:MAG TPA: AMP-binding protein [Methylomirabilota bacterium]|jgi:acetyl-CoA synthetase
MKPILDVHRYPDAVHAFTWDALWTLFDGNRERLNLAHECVDRHPGRATALRLQRADGRRVEHSFAELAEWSSRFARFLERAGVERGDRVAVMLEPSLAFYGAVFGTVKRGAIAVPLFTLFGPDGVALRVRDCRPRLLLVESDAGRWRSLFPDVRVIEHDELAALLAGERPQYAPVTAADDLAVFQYTSGTTRALPAAVRHTHRSVVTLMVGALFGVGLRAGDRYFCPSSPAWGHGLWHGTIAPLALGIAVGAYAGKFEATRLLEALDAFAITNLAAAPTVFRLLAAAEGHAPVPHPAPQKISFTGEPMDARTFAFVEHAFGVRPCGMYGTTEIGVVIVNYPGFEGYEVRPGALGKAAPGWEVAIVDAEGRVLPPNSVGEIAVRRKSGWVLAKDRGFMDEDGYFHHGGRSDDVIISAGWTMSAVEIEDVLLRHPAVHEAAVIGVADALRGQIAKAFVVSSRPGPELEVELQEFLKARLSRHEYPRAVEFVEELPKTPAGKVDRRALRERGPGL